MFPNATSTLAIAKTSADALILTKKSVLYRNNSISMTCTQGLVVKFSETYHIHTLNSSLRCCRTQCTHCAHHKVRKYLVIGFGFFGLVVTPIRDLSCRFIVDFDSLMS